MSAEATRQGIITMLMGMDDETQLAEIAEFLGRNPFHRFRSGGEKIYCVDAAGVRYQRVLDLRLLSDFEMEGAMNLLDSSPCMYIGPEGFVIKGEGELTEVEE